ncbi:hypothetical protein OG698_45725 [Streptomyces sp. NBC_01003]|uniref:hypothetical protein n=1 Tax=Streptomyces sp. NBC_01003 TaxID=2903714 RepID=UPI0038643825|nr:hypothetical protein OG698_45725 [Streptomyces sp. NBC_01003]
MSWVPWAISSMGAALLLMAALGHCASPDGPAETIRTHRIYRVRLPLVMGWIFLVGWLPQALHTPWPVATICRLIAPAPAVLIFFAARRRAL